MFEYFDCFFFGFVETSPPVLPATCEVFREFPLPAELLFPAPKLLWYCSEDLLGRDFASSFETLECLWEEEDPEGAGDFPCPTILPMAAFLENGAGDTERSREGFGLPSLCIRKTYMHTLGRGGRGEGGQVCVWLISNRQLLVGTFLLLRHSEIFV